MSAPYIVCDANGVILRTGLSPVSMIAMQAGAGQTAMPGVADDAKQYVDTATLQVVDKPPLDGTTNKTTALANGTDVVTIGNFPNPTTARITGPGVNQTATVTDGTLELTFAAPGVYRVRLSALNRLDQEIDINAA